MENATAAATVTRHVGNCQICATDYKLTADDKLVHHGYRRPGWGTIVGDCEGVGAPPYEVSCDALRAYADRVRGERAATVARLEALRAGEVTHLTETGGSRNPDGSRHTYELHAGVTAAYIWLNAIDDRIRMTEYRARQLADEITRCDQRANEWAPAPIRTVEEMAAREDAAKADRAAAVAAKRAERAAKETANAAKRAELEAKHEATKAALKAGFAALAATPPGDDRRLAVAKLCRKLRTNTWLWTHELGIDETFMALGIAERTATGHVRYLYPLAS